MTTAWIPSGHPGLAPHCHALWKVGQDCCTQHGHSPDGLRIPGGRWNPAAGPLWIPAPAWTPCLASHIASAARNFQATEYHENPPPAPRILSGDDYS